MNVIRLSVSNTSNVSYLSIIIYLECITPLLWNVRYPTIFHCYWHLEEYRGVWCFYLSDVVDCWRTQWMWRTFQRPNTAQFIIPTETHYKAKTEKWLIQRVLILVLRGQAVYWSVKARSVSGGWKGKDWGDRAGRCFKLPLQSPLNYKVNPYCSEFMPSFLSSSHLWNGRLPQKRMLALYSLFWLFIPL